MGTVPFGSFVKNEPNGTVPNGPALLSEGNVIEHERFGIGTVISVEGTGGDTKAVIRFINLGEKTLLLKFAKYIILK